MLLTRECIKRSHGTFFFIMSASTFDTLSPFCWYLFSTCTVFSHCGSVDFFSLCSCDRFISYLPHNNLIKVKWHHGNYCLFVKHSTNNIAVCIIIYSHIFFTYYMLLLLQFWSISGIHFQYSRDGILYLLIIFIFMHAKYYIEQEQDANK